MARMRYLSTVYWLLIIGLIHSMLVGLLLYQKSNYIARSYAFQDLEKRYTALQAELQSVLQERACMQRRDTILVYAREQLGMTVVPLSSVYTIDDAL